MEPLGIGGGEVVQKELKERGVERRQFEKEAAPGQGFHGAIQVQTLEALGRGQDGLDAGGGDSAPDDRQQATPTLILDPQAALSIAGPASGRYLGLEVGGERARKLLDRGKVFLGCERRGALSLALSL